MMFVFDNLTYHLDESLGWFISMTL